MSYKTTITKKGQLTLPKKVREILHLHLGERVLLEPDEKDKSVKITPLPSIEKLAGSFTVKNPRNPVALRNIMERNYRRI